MYNKMFMFSWKKQSNENINFSATKCSKVNCKIIFKNLGLFILLQIGFVFAKKGNFRLEINNFKGGSGESKKWCLLPMMH